MCRLTDRIVLSTLVTAWFLAGCPVSTSPFLANATMDGVVREPSELAMTVGSPPSRTATTELVVPRSMPTARAMGCSSCVSFVGLWGCDFHPEPDRLKFSAPPVCRLGADLSLPHSTLPPGQRVGRAVCSRPGQAM